PTALLTQSPSVHRSGCPLGSHAWILIAMFHLAMDLASCQPPAATGAGGKLSARPALRHRLSRGSLWGTAGTEELQRPGPPWTCGPAPPVQRPRSRRPPPAAPLPAARPLRRPRSRRGRRHLRGRGFAPRDGRPTALPEVIVWGPTGEEDSLESSTLPSAFATTTTTATAAAATTAASTAAAAVTSVTAATPPRVPPSTAAPAAGGDGPRGSPGRSSTAEPAAGHSSGGKDARPPRGLGDSTGLAVHQIITITVSLIMVIAALITTLVLKN
ncbi:AJAP1 protein, partial [Passerina amoena]|nr:AJAP1 protein [Passerina amoena]